MKHLCHFCMIRYKKFESIMYNKRKLGSIKGSEVMNKYKYVGRLIILLILAGIIVYFFHFKWSLTPNEIRSFILSFGWISPFIFWMIYALGPFVFFPASLLSIAAGLSYGAWPGILYIWIGVSGAAITGYGIGRFLGKYIVKWHSMSWSDLAHTKIKENGFLYVLILRLIPLMGFDLLCYISGFAKVRFSHYMVATMLGVLPGATAYGMLGSSIASGNRSLIFIVLIMFVTMFGVSYKYRSRVKEWLGLDHEEK